MVCARALTSTILQELSRNYNAQCDFFCVFQLYNCLHNYRKGSYNCNEFLEKVYIA